jgi:hypothetical protein
VDLAFRAIMCDQTFHESPLEGMFVASRQVDAGQERATIIFTTLCLVTFCDFLCSWLQRGLDSGQLRFMGPFIKEQNIFGRLAK